MASIEFISLGVINRVIHLDTCLQCKATCFIVFYYLTTELLLRHILRASVSTKCCKREQTIDDKDDDDDDDDDEDNDNDNNKDEKKSI